MAFLTSDPSQGMANTSTCSAVILVFILSPKPAGIVDCEEAKSCSK
ncbi:hypothetical protein COLO4_05236 [Corchorus olitorius]|uniref:Uncharacterized protein n=1 Tax=Corchorus olitorius TaxID=93759 RepID=A0A1R3KRF8_9ROSI|nr:hypothetical protein COLO4_05236 [Corchorus olitorius]